MKKVMLHIIMPNQVSGPNTASKLIGNSFLNKRYKFGYLVQTELAGGFNMKLIKNLKKQIIDFEPDLIHLSGLQNSGLHAVIAARLAGYKNILIAVRGSTTESILINPLKKAFFNFVIEPLTLLLCNKFYLVSNQMGKKFFIKLNKKKSLGTIYNSAPVIRKEMIADIGFRRQYGFSPDKVVIAVVGRLIYDKGINFIVQAIKKIKNPNNIFVFIGDGPSEVDIRTNLAQEIANSRVILTGKTNKVLSILKESDIFLFATLHENLSNALLEACSMGMAVVATAVGGNTEVIEHKRNGLLIRPYNSADIVDAIETLTNNKLKRIQLGREAMLDVENKFSQQKLLTRIGEIYDMLIVNKNNMYEENNKNN